MNHTRIKPKNQKTIRNCLLSIVTVSLLVSGCGPGQLFGPTLTPTPTTTLTPTLTPTPTLTLTPTLTFTPTITPTPTPVAATLDDNLCEIKGSFTLDGTLSLNAASTFDQVVENEPRYALSFYGFSKFMDVWIKHTASPGPNEMEDLPKRYQVSKVNIYSADNTAFHGDSVSARLTLHVIPDMLPIANPPASVANLIYTCDFVVEQIQLQ